MYAIAHGATALAIKRAVPQAPLPALLIAVQAVELGWIALTYLGIERFTTTADAVHLAFLPYSHSIASGLALGLITFAICAAMRQPRIGLALALGVASHVLLDIIHHEPDISILPFAGSMRVGFDLAGSPWLDLAVETGWCLACWWLVRGSGALLIALVVLNLVNAPLMHPAPGTGTLIAAHRWMLPTLILFQFALCSLAIYWLARPAAGIGGSIERKHMP